MVDIADFRTWPDFQPEFLHYKDHLQCGEIARPLIQSTLFSNNGHPAVSRVSHRTCIRTPAPSRPISHQSSCVPPHPTQSFLSLPPEIRVHIYRLLLTRPDSIDYQICLKCQSIICRRWKKHWIYPAILECCRLINQEGTPVLYGENTFHAVNKLIDDTTNICLQTWPISTPNFKSITRVRLTVEDFADVLRVLDTLGELKELDVCYIWYKVVGWTEFIRAVSNKVGGIDRAVFRIAFTSLMRSEELPSGRGREGFLESFSDVLGEPGIFAAYRTVHLEQKESREIQHPEVLWSGNMLLTVER